jgi:hypothetical protein
MTEQPHPDHELFANFAAELVHLDNSEAWRIIRQWMINQGDRYHHNFKPTADLIWKERHKLRQQHPQYWRRAISMKKHISGAA